MSNFKLRALLEDTEFCSAISNCSPANPYNNHSVIHNKGSYELAEVGRPGNASLLKNNIWDNSGNAEGEDNFNLEYMDLDEFLTETGLLDANFTDLVNNASASATQPTRFMPSPPATYTLSPQAAYAPSPQTAFRFSPLGTFIPSPQACVHTSSPPPPPPPQNTKQSCIEKLLLTTETSPSHSASTSSTQPISAPSSPSYGPRPTPQQSPFHTPPTTHTADIILSEGHRQESDRDTKPAVSKSVKLTASQVVKKRRYSEDGEGLTDTTVVVVPGQDGFDPAVAKFSSDELQPQPLIKKSKKQFVPEDSKDDKYWKRRNKNNVAAKRSREARRAKENQIIMRAGFLESENDRLTGENTELQQENEKLRSIIERLQQGQL